jgi:hypothetical protein
MIRSGIVVRKKGKERVPYKKRIIEERGKTGVEMRIQKKFWQEYTMDQIMSMEFKDLNKLIDDFMQRYEDRRKKENYLWWYPEREPGEMKKIRKASKKLDKQSFN